MFSSHFTQLNTLPNKFTSVPEVKSTYTPGSFIKHAEPALCFFRWYAEFLQQTWCKEVVEKKRKREREGRFHVIGHFKFLSRLGPLHL